MKNEEIKFRLVKLILSENVFENMKRLYRKDELKREIIKHYYLKVKTCLIIVAVFTLVSFGIKFTGEGTEIKNGKIKRNESGGLNKSVNVDIFLEDEKLYEKKIDVASKKYNDEEIEKLFVSFEKEIRDVIKGENKSLDYVTKDLIFKKNIAGFPFAISYKTDKPLIISGDGKVKNEKIEKEEIVEISVTAKYEKFEETELIYVQVFNKEKTKDEMLIEKVNNALEENDEITKDEDYFLFPVKVGGKNIYYKEKNNGSSIIVFILGLISAAVFYYGKDKEIDDKITLIKKEMDLEYAILVNKFALFYNANMPIKKIWKKICDDYENEKKNTGVKKYVYEEMLYAEGLMNEGMGEIRAYEEFAKRCSTHKYRVFVSLLEQAVTKGRRDMSNILINEAKEAFIKRKNDARRLGEEAGTKLLIPMFMMLMIVMVMIIFPAFYSFKM